MAPLTGILLAAGSGSRFDPAGRKNKLLQPLPNGDAVALASAKNLLAVLPSVLAVVRPGPVSLRLQLEALGCRVTECAQADLGMGVSLVHALRQVADADGWLIALGDMPYVRAATIRQLQEAIHQGADIAVPTLEGRRGNPVAFSRRHLAALLTLGGDLGARRLLQSLPVTEVALDDPGILQDIDIPADLV